MPPPGDSSEATGTTPAGLAGVLPGVAASLGVEALARRADDRADAPGPAGGGRARRRARLRAAAATRRPRAVPALAPARGIPASPAGFPSTTATSMGTLRHRPAAGRARAGRLRGARAGGGPPAQRAVLGGRPRPAALAAPADGVRGVAAAEASRSPRIGPGFFDGSGLTEAALRGGRFRAARARWRGRVDATLAARARRRRGRSSTSTGASSTRSATCTAASPGSGATSSRRSTASWRGSRAPCPRTTARLRHRRPRHGRRPARAADRPGLRAELARRGPARRRARPARPAALRRAGRRGRRPAPPGRSGSATGPGSCAPATRRCAAGWFGPVQPR